MTLDKKKTYHERGAKAANFLVFPARFIKVIKALRAFRGNGIECFDKNIEKLKKKKGKGKETYIFFSFSTFVCPGPECL